MRGLPLDNTQAIDQPGISMLAMRSSGRGEILRWETTVINEIRKRVCASPIPMAILTDRHNGVGQPCSGAGRDSRGSGCEKGFSHQEPDVEPDVAAEGATNVDVTDKRHLFGYRKPVGWM
jgi:hypothetical protein